MIWIFINYIKTNMKNIVDIVEAKAGPLKKLDMLTIMVAYQMWKEYKLYDEFFGKLDDKEQKSYEELVKRLGQLDEDDAKVQWSFLKKYFTIIDKTADYVLSEPDDVFSKSDKRVWKEIKTHVS